MSKQKLFYLLLVAPLLFVVFWSYSDSLLDLVSDTSGWHNIESRDKYWLTALNNSNHSVWFAEFWGDKELSYYVPSKNRTFSLGVRSAIDSICTSDRTWLTLIQENTYEIESIDTTSNLEVNYPNMGNFGHVYCVATPDNKTLFVGDKLLVLFDGQNISKNYWTINKELLRVVQKSSGEILALTRDGEIYIANSLNSEWRLFGEVQRVSQLKLVNDTLWLGIYETNKIYKWNLTAKSPELFTLENNNQNGPQFLVTVEEVAPNVIWIITTTGIWEYQQNKQFKEIGMPMFTKHVSSAVFDKEFKRIYLATNRGIYFKDIGQP